MIGRIIDFFKTGEDKTLFTRNPTELERIYERLFKNMNIIEKI
jgi:hypothetical protein